MSVRWIWTADAGQSAWEAVSDRVMGGVSEGTLALTDLDGRLALRLTGRVSLENDGGFLQMARDMDPAPRAAGIALTLRGCGQGYNLHLRTRDLDRPWQSFRAPLPTDGTWQEHRIRWADLAPHRTEARFDPATLCRLGLVAIGQEMEADLALHRLGLIDA